jgi:DNA gyrase subunit A
MIKDPEINLEKLLKIIPGPDFPSSGVIAGRQGIIQAYKTGRGVISLKAIAEIEPGKGDRERIIVSELPFQVNKARLIENMAELVKEKKIEGISDIRDESSREGLRIVIDIKKGENASVVLNRLYKFTQLQTSFGIIMLALDEGSQPRVFDLKGLLRAFLNHRQEVVTRRCVYDLKKAEERIHILEGLKLALDQIDQVVATIRASRETATAREALITKFGLSEVQAQAILEMRLARLTGLEREKIIGEIKELEAKIAWLKKILADVTEIYKIVAEELNAIKAKFDNPRRTRIEGDSDEVHDEDLITKENVVVTITHSGYIKRIPIDTYRTQHRGGKGLQGMETRDEDFVSEMFVANTHTTLLVFTDKGKVYWQKVFKLPEGTRQSKGKAIANVVNISGNEKVQAILPVDEFREDQYIVMLTKAGIIKKTSLDAFSNPRPSGIIALTTDLDDSVIQCKISSGKDDIFIATEEGMSIRFDESNVRPMGRTARGVKAITLGKGDFVAGMEILSTEEKRTILMVTEFGYGKRTTAEEYRRQSRGGVGIITQKVTDKVGRVVSTRIVEDSNDVMLITDKGTLIRLPCSQVSTLGRNTQGVRLINVSEGEKVTSMTLVAEKETDPAQ